MTWDEQKNTSETRPDVPAEEKITASDYNAMVADQKGHSSRHEETGSDSLGVFDLVGSLTGQGLERVGDSLQVLSSIWDGTNITANVNNESVHTEEAHSGVATTDRHVSLGTKTSAERNYGYLPTMWTHEADLYTDSDMNRHVSWPCIVDAQVVFDDPVANYYLYYSGYRSNEVRLLTSNSIESGWTFHSTVLDLSVSDDISDDLDTPWPLYDPFSDELHIYFHAQTNSDLTDQFTVRASSPNGIGSWTYDGRVLDLTLDRSSNRFDHTERAYLSVYRDGKSCYGYYAGQGSGSDATQIGFAWSPSGDIDDWRTRETPLFGGDWVKRYSRAVEIIINGQPHLLVRDQIDEEMKVGPFTGFDDKSLYYEGGDSRLSPAPDPFVSTNLHEQFYVPFYTNEKLYLTTGGPFGASDENTIKLFSANWSDLA